jgi:hypothetical protein
VENTRVHLFLYPVSEKHIRSAAVSVEILSAALRHTANVSYPEIQPAKEATAHAQDVALLQLYHRDYHSPGQLGGPTHIATGPKQWAHSNGPFRKQTVQAANN